MIVAVICSLITLVLFGPVCFWLGLLIGGAENDWYHGRDI